MKKYDLYLFDFDGTLFYTLPSLIDIFLGAFKKVGLDAKEEDCLRYSRIPLAESFAELGGTDDLVAPFVEELERLIDDKDIMAKSKKYPESDEFFSYINKNKIRAGIVTSNNRTHVYDMFEEFDVPKDTFEIVVGNKEAEGTKPDPRPLLKALELAGIKKEDYHKVVYIGDALNDALAADNAGVDAILLDRNKEFDHIDKYPKIYNLMELFK